MSKPGPISLPLPLEEPPDAWLLKERYRWSARHKRVVRVITTRDRGEFTTSLRMTGRGRKPVDLPAAYDRLWLRSGSVPRSNVPSSAPTVRIADLFCGCGAMTLGVLEACRALRLRSEPVLAMDFEQDALATYRRNFPTAELISDPIEAVLDSEPGEPLSESEQRLKERIGRVDLAVGGPPCQGSSDLNNQTRRDDPKNALMAKMARFAQVFEPAHVIIENVPGVVYDRKNVVERTEEALKASGYSVDRGHVDLSDIGVPQGRRRFILIASRRPASLKRIVSAFRRPVRTIRWAIEDLMDSTGSAVLDESSKPTPVTAARIDYLFDNGIFDLPDDQRPECHRGGQHSYRSVYGRLEWDSPAQTITTGFGCMGQGRFVHPERRRTLTAHEAARLQFFPDFFDFGETRRTRLAQLIGNAVPPKLTYVVSLALLASP